MQTFLNELYYQTDENKSMNMYGFSSVKKEKNLFNKISKNTKNNNDNPKPKSNLFLNNFFRPNKTQKTQNNKIIGSNNKSIKNFKKRKKKNINVNPYQKMGNEYILNFALNNLNKYQENLLVKENTEDEKNNMNNNNDFNNKINYYNNFLIENNENENLTNLRMNKSSKNFFLSHKSNKEDLMKENNNENNFPKFYSNNKHYTEYFVKNDLFNNKNNIKDEGEGNEEIPEPEPYVINKYITKNKSYNYFNKPKINNNNFESKSEIIKQTNINKKNINSKLNKINIDVKLNFTLSNLELNELKNVFEENYIYFEDLFLLTKEDFVEMKIPIGPRNRLLNFIKKYKYYAKTFDLNELSLFMNQYKESINSNEINNTIDETPSTNNKYKSTMTTENNNKNKGSNNSLGKGLNLSNLEERESLKQQKIKNDKHNTNNQIIDDLNEVINQNHENDNNSNKRCNTYKTNQTKNLDNEEDENENENNINKNIFTNSLFNDVTSYATELKELNFEEINLKNNNNKNNTNKIAKPNSLKKECLNNLISKNPSPFITSNNFGKFNAPKNNNQNICGNKKNRGQNTYIKNYQNIFSEIEKYQMNYEKMKKENDDRNNKINNLLDKKNKTNIQYLKLKLKNSKYYNDEDLKNENIRDLNKELQKMNFFQQEVDPNNHFKIGEKKKDIKNPLIEEFNKHK